MQNYLDNLGWIIQLSYAAEKYELNPDEEWYFLSALKREDIRYGNASHLPKKLGVDEGGFWRLKIRKKVFDPNAREGRKLVGHKKIYRYHQPVIGKPGVFCRTKWIMVLHTVLPTTEVLNLTVT